MKRLKDILRTRLFVDFTDALDFGNLHNLFTRESLDKIRPGVDFGTQLLIDDIQEKNRENFKSKEGQELKQEYKELQNEIGDILFSKNTEVIPEHVKVAKILQTYDIDACFVGGCIRDAALGIEPKDYDFVTKTPYLELKEIFEKFNYTVKEKGKQFLVLIISKKVKNVTYNFEIANFRRDKDNSGAEIGTIEEDALRRDFTVNAGYFRISDKTLLDPNAESSVGFLDDIKTKTLRFIGKPQHRLIEDPNRVFRFYRFCSRGFTPDKKSLQAVRANFAWCLEKTDQNRIREEIERMCNI